MDHTSDGRVVLAGTERLAGSALRMNDGVANVMRLAQLNMRDAVRMATANPAHMAKIANGLRIGAPADLVLFEETIKVEAVYRDGERVAH